LINISLRSKKTKVADSAKHLKNYLTKLSPHIYSEDYSAETTLLRKIYKDCQTVADLKDAVAAITGAQDWLNEINTANTAFEDKYVARTNTIADDKNVEPFSAVRQPSIKAYQALTTIIESRYHVLEEDEILQ
jgi:hypothetical protein